MKIPKQFRLSEEACEILDKQDNATQFIEDLILGEVTVPVPWLNLEKRIDDLSAEIKKIVLPEAKDDWVEVGNERYATQGKPGEPAIELGYACCKGSKPCKHWVWDDSTGDGYVNSITGEVREA